MNYSVKRAGQGLLYVYCDDDRTNWNISNVNGVWKLYTNIDDPRSEGVSRSIHFNLAPLIHHPKELGEKISQLLQEEQKAFQRLTT